MSNWRSYETVVHKGPWPIFWKLLGTIAAMAVVLMLVGIPLGWFSQATQVAMEQFGPRELLRKYEWFKDVAASLDAKRASLGVMTTRSRTMEEIYAGVPRKEWPRDDREQFNLWESEVAGITLSYNNLAAEYNSQMSKFNWRFCEVGSLPAGAEVPLPREYKPYIHK